MIPDRGASPKPELDGSGRIACLYQVRCRVCGQTTDLPSSTVHVPEENGGFLLETCTVVYQGICIQCQEKLLSK